MQVAIPDLNLPSFEKMTLSSQLSIVEDLLSNREKQSVVLFGSSMGGLISTILSLKYDAIRSMILLAPGFGLERRWQALWGEGALERWRTDGYLEVHHYAYEKEMKLDVSFLDDALRYQTDGFKISVPTLVIHGLHDDVVPAEESRRFAEENPDFVDLNLVNDDHFLMADLETTWQRAHNHIIANG